MRATRQRTAITKVLRETEGFRSAQEIHEALKREGQRVGLTTVYRTLQGLVDAGQIDVLRTDDGESIYRRCANPGHHHHLVCRSCARSIEIVNDDVERWAKRTATRHGFSAVTHTVEVYGLCSDCVSDDG